MLGRCLGCLQKKQNPTVVSFPDASRAEEKTDALCSAASTMENAVVAFARLFSTPTPAPSYVY